MKSSAFYRMFEPNCHLLWENYSVNLFLKLVSDNYKVPYVPTFKITVFRIQFWTCLECLFRDPFILSMLRAPGYQGYTVRQGQRESVGEVSAASARWSRSTWLSYFFFSLKWKNSRPQPYLQTKAKKKKYKNCPIFWCNILFWPFFVVICTLFSIFLGPEAFRGPSCFFKTLKVFDTTPLAS